jgi:hypothetical protein
VPQNCGSHASVINSGMSAHRPNAADDFNFGVVLTNRPLRANEVFEVSKGPSTRVPFCVRFPVRLHVRFPAKCVGKLIFTFVALKCGDISDEEFDFYLVCMQIVHQIVCEIVRFAYNRSRLLIFHPTPITTVCKRISRKIN